MHVNKSCFSKFGTIFGIIILVLSMACETGGEVKLSGSNTGHVKYDAKVRVKFQFMIIGEYYPVEPEYTIDVVGYPYNHLVFTGAQISRYDSGKIRSSTPMILQDGSTLNTTISIGDFSRTYLATVRTNSDLPVGSYILLAPGLVQDVQVAQQAYPESKMSIITNGVGIQASLPQSSELAMVAQSQIGAANIVFEIPPEDLSPWGALRTAPDPIKPPRQGPFLPTQE